MRERSVVYTSVLVALDGSQLAAQAIPHGVELARKLSVPLILLRVLGFGSSVASEVTAGVGQREHDSRRSQAEGYLEAMRRAISHSGVRIETRVEEGQAPEVILRVAETLPDSLLVITSSGRSTSELHNLGSVAERLSRECPVPLLIVKAERSEGARV